MPFGEFPQSTSGAGTGGGGTPGASIVRAFPFAFDTPNILTGAALYTPTVDDVLLDAWVEIDTAWDGTTPQGDFGTFQAPNTNGWLVNTLSGAPLDMTSADFDIATSDGLLVGFNNFGGSLALVQAMADSEATTGGTVPGNSERTPGKFTAAHPVKVVVSQDGTNTGADPGSTQGAAVLYLVTATPA